MHTIFPSMLLLVVLLSALPLAAQGDSRCFAETGHCISGRFATFWQQQGGLAQFGYPLTDAQEQVVEGQLRLVQWFERARFELHPEQLAPSDVLLGRVGAERLAQLPADAGVPLAQLPGDCQEFAATNQQVCGVFLRAWRARGIELDGLPGTSQAESLALFGLPLTGVRREVLDGREYSVQWFERARFELHPELPAPYDLLFGRLGSELRAVPPATPTPLPSATPSNTPRPERPRPSRTPRPTISPPTITPTLPPATLPPYP